MKIIKKIFLIVLLVIFLISMFNLSWELGLSSLILISTILCIWFVLKKITIIVNNPDLVSNSESNVGTKKQELSKTSLNEENSLSKKIISGIDSSIFEKFRKNLKIYSNHTSENKINSEKLRNDDFAKKAYEKSATINNSENFSEELDEKENVKVTLSQNAKNFNDQQNNFFLNENESINQEKTSENSKNEEDLSLKKLGAGEEALKILSSKHQELKKQNESLPSDELVRYKDDIFADELIPIPGNEDIFRNVNKDGHDEKKDLNSDLSSYLHEEEFLENSMKKNSTTDEKKAEAEALLKLATTSCESGRMEEAKASLKIYMDLLNDLKKQPSNDVKDLANKLDIPINSSESSKTIVKKSEQNNREGDILQDLPEQANYANVMDSLVKSLEEKEAFEEALPLLMDLLEYNRKRGNISDMDSLYNRIEQAYSSLKKDIELVSAYKEHLSIKQQLDDLEGELNLLDLISYYYANTGDQNASELYQEERKRVKTKLEQKISSEENLQI